MWCPAGQATFLEIEKSIRLIVKSVRSQPYMCGDMTIVDVGTYEQFLFHNCITEFFSKTKSLSVYSASGESLRIHPRIATHHLFPKIGWQYSFIDKSVGLVSAQQLQRCFVTVKPRLAELRSRVDELDDEASPFYEYPEYTEYSEYSEYCELSEIEDDYSHWNIFGNFDGWAVGCDEEDLPRDSLEFVALDEQSLGQKANIPNRDMVSEILQAFDAGYLRSKEHLWRTTFRGEKREAFRAAWTKAATLRPGLSKRGPKTL
jgi:hypothetical protein